MFKSILVPTDGSRLSGKAVNAAIQFARQIDGKIIAISVSDPYPFQPLSEGAFFGGSAAYEERARELAREHVREVAVAANAANVRCETVVAHSSSPYEEILKAAQKFNCDLIFMASHGRKGLNKLLIGSETQKVLAHSTIPVLVFR